MFIFSKKSFVLCLTLFSFAVQAELRLVTLSPHLTELVFLLGKGESIVATVAHSDFPDAANNIRRIGDHASINLEAVLALKPDYVLAWRGGNSAKNLKRMRELGLNVVGFEPLQPADIARDLHQLGILLSVEPAAKKLASRFLTELDEIKKIASRNTQLRALYVIWQKPLTAVSPRTWPGSLLSYCQVENVIDESDTLFPIINTEHILSLQPDILIYPLDENTPHDVEQNKAWALLPPVKLGKVIYPDADILHRMTPRMTSELRRMCESIEQIRQQITSKKEIQ